MITYYTFVLHSPATPLGLLPESWNVMHQCSRCHEWVESDRLMLTCLSARRGGGRHRLTYTHHKLVASLNNWGISVIESGE